MSVCLIAYLLHQIRIREIQINGDPDQFAHHCLFPINYSKLFISRLSVDEEEDSSYTIYENVNLFAKEKRLQNFFIFLFFKGFFLFFSPFTASNFAFVYSQK